MREVSFGKLADLFLYLADGCGCGQLGSEIYTDTAEEFFWEGGERFSVIVAEDTAPGSADINRDDFTVGVLDYEGKAIFEGLNAAIASHSAFGEDTDGLA